MNKMPHYTHSIPDLRLGEFDIGGVLYHAHYYHLYEMAREALLRDHGIPYSDFVAHGEHLAIVEANQEFRRPVRYGQKLKVSLSFTGIRRSVFDCHYEISTPGLGLLHVGRTRHVFVRSAGGNFKPGPLPENLLKVLKNFEIGTA